MQKLKYVFFLAGMVFLFSACDEEKLIDEVDAAVTSGAVLRNLGETNNLDSANAASSYSIILEAQDAQNGALLSEVRVLVGYDDDDGSGSGDITQTLFQTIPASSFSVANAPAGVTNGLPVSTFTITLGEALAHVGISQADINGGDDISVYFEMVLTDGRVFNFDNATGDVTRTGTFSYFNAQFRYFPEIE